MYIFKAILFNQCSFLFWLHFTKFGMHCFYYHLITNSTVRHAWIKLISVRQITGGPHLGTLDSQHLSITLGGHIKQRNYQQRHKNMEMVTLKDHTRDTCLLYESWNRKAEHRLVGLQPIRDSHISPLYPWPQITVNMLQEFIWEITNKFLKVRKFANTEPTNK